MNCKKSILAGILIGIGGTAFLSVGSKELGSALFSLGLLAVIILECNLYTGKVGYIKKPSEIGTLALMCIRNFIGAAIVGAAAYVLMKDGGTAQEIADKKLDLPFGTVFIKAIMCGIMIYLAVELYKRSKQIWLVVLPIMIFILCGFEHCVADVFYFAAAGVLSIRAVLFVLLCAVGNAAGSLLIRLLQEYE
ncbi:MAG: formate/nitrite transporter family protein [Clostridiales bacterium]|nr:formate/nitrite transporter family protein [Clostridiales bacterium]